MPKTHSSVQAVKEQAKQTVTNAVANPWIDRFARFGYAAKGVVHIIVGLLATEVALGLGGQVTDSEGALKPNKMLSKIRFWVVEAKKEIWILFLRLDECHSQIVYFLAG
ncbi:MAG: DUF1206 domain-containing protein [Symplocastrum torsivum CPER-KK1]|jgi:hypothetical protein|uniref:DUF1206 domain-containing protein n=1 Tax=Symplocastrum torsivum CPER-KK1 TaxID=450513 RepID=A0A951PHS9_9CYAN|nr:DUF1206 domain-containing protein [Symplocastrum torsivum CPER-KK1]